MCVSTLVLFVPRGPAVVFVARARGAARRLGANDPNATAAIAGVFEPFVSFVVARHVPPSDR